MPERQLTSDDLRRRISDTEEGPSPPGGKKYQTIARRLEGRFGLGDSPVLRRVFFKKLQQKAIEHGPDVYESIAECVERACGPGIDAPGEYFCVAIKRKLEELGVYAKPVDF